MFVADDSSLRGFNSFTKSILGADSTVSETTVNPSLLTSSISISFFTLPVFPFNEQLVKIKDKINEGSKIVDKQLTETVAEQKILRGRMKDTVDLVKKELALEKKNNSVDKQKK